MTLKKLFPLFYQKEALNKNRSQTDAHTDSYSKNIVIKDLLLKNVDTDQPKRFY